MKMIKKSLLDLKKWEKFLLIFTLAFTLLYFIFFLTFVNSKSNEWILILIATITIDFGIVGEIFSEKRNIHNYLVGGIHVLFYSLLAFNAKYYSSFALNFFFFLPMQFIGFYFWRKNVDSEQKYENVKTFKRTSLIFFLFLTILFYFVFSFLFKSKTDDPLPFVESAGTWLSIVAMFLMIYGFWEQWILWIIVNLITIGMWAYSFSSSIGTYDASFYFSFELIYMWIIYLIISIVGLTNWRKKYKSEKVFKVLKNKNMINISQVSLSKKFNVQNYKYYYSKDFLTYNFENIKINFFDLNYLIPKNILKDINLENKNYFLYN
ncbi:MAG: hypothetical protein HPAVJP_2580 [Candidatus Hepatoplasma vulgare]|nr:MAG: hypothetical protein HPAVJP_2580 [Candidatus Hepatoplasma sp.]